MIKLAILATSDSGRPDAPAKNLAASPGASGVGIVLALTVAARARIARS